MLPAFANFQHTITCAVACTWTDLPRTPFGELADVPGDIDGLERLVEDYHFLHKTSLFNLSLRVEMLQQVANYLRKRSEEWSKYPFIQRLTLVVLGKLTYLKQIKSFYCQYDSLEHYMANQSVREGLMGLKNNLYFNCRTGRYYGVFATEMLDPCHRDLASYYHEWKYLEQPRPLFFLWLEERLAYHHDVKTVKYCTDSELQQHLHLCEEGLIRASVPVESTTHLNIPDTTKPGALFIISEDDNLYIAASNIQDYRHTSLSQGKEVKAAGLIWAKLGKVTQLFFMSGHYRPTLQDGLNTISYFKELGIILDDSVIIQYYEQGCVKECSVNQFTEIASRDSNEVKQRI